jgi:hypothetical protein
MELRYCPVIVFIRADECRHGHGHDGLATRNFVLGIAVLRLWHLPPSRPPDRLYYEAGSAGASQPTAVRISGHSLEARADLSSLLFFSAARIMNLEKKRIPIYRAFPILKNRYKYLAFEPIFQFKFFRHALGPAPRDFPFENYYYNRTTYREKADFLHSRRISCKIRWQLQAMRQSHRYRTMRSSMRRTKR